VLADNPNAADGCSGEQEIEYDLQIFDQPKASFLYTHTGCLSDSVAFTDNTDGKGRPVVRWIWEFGDASTSALKDPKHKYATPNTFTVRHYAITDVGCLSDTVEKTINLLFRPPRVKSLRLRSRINPIH
jgi:PKD repeat protein